MCLVSVIQSTNKETVIKSIKTICESANKLSKEKSNSNFQINKNFHFRFPKNNKNRFQEIKKLCNLLHQSACNLRGNAIFNNIEKSFTCTKKKKLSLELVLSRNRI